MATLTMVATLQASVNNNSTVTVPAGVTSSHLGIAVFISANLYSTGSVPAISGWKGQISNPSVANNMEWTVLTRLGGVKAGDVLTITENLSTQFDLYMIWYDTAGLDVATVGTPGGRSGTSSSFVVINGVNASAGQGIIVISSERSTAVGTLVSSWSGNYTPGNDNFVESATAVASSNMFAHFAPTTNGATGNITANYNMASGNGAGVLLVLGQPPIGSFTDPFTNANWSSGTTWFSTYSNTYITMANGTLTIPYSGQSPWIYPQVAMPINNSSFAVEVTMTDVQVGSFSMRLTTDSPVQQGNSFISCGIQAGGQLYMNHRTYNGTTSTDDRTVYNSGPTVALNAPIGLRLRSGGTSVIYFDYSYDMVNWTNLGSKTVTCFNPLTASVTPMFQSGTSDNSDKANGVAIQNMNLNTWTPPAAQAPVPTGLWTVWDGTREVEYIPPVGWTWYTVLTDPISGGTPVLCGPGTITGTTTYPEPDSEPYPDATVYPDGDYPGANSYPGAQTYPDYSNIYPGG